MATLTGKKVQDTYKDLLQVSNTNSGIDGTMRAVEDGEGSASLLYLSTAGVAVNTGLNIGAATAVTGGKVTQTAALSAATGDEIAYSLAYTTNKASSGNDYGLKIVQTDTASPGTSYLIDALVASSSKFYVTNEGKSVHTATLDDATGDEVAVNIAYTTNKATSGADTGLQIVQTDTASPGTSYLINALVASASKFNVTNAGVLTAASDICAAGGSITKLSSEFLGVQAGTANATYVGNLFNYGAHIPVAGQFGWGDHSSLGADDTGLARSSAGVVKVTDGSTSYGTLDVPTIQAAPKTTDAASQAVTIMGGDAFAGAATNVTGGALNLSGGIGKRIYTIVDYTALAGKTVTVTINGSSTTLTEGVEWTAATGNNETATSLAAAVHALSGVTASASTADVRVVPDPTTYSLKLATNGAAALTITTGADGTTTVNSLLTAATGNESAFKIAYEENKAAGNGTGLEIVQTDTASGGTSYLIDAKVATSKRFHISNDGVLHLNNASNHSFYLSPGASSTLALTTDGGTTYAALAQGPSSFYNLSNQRLAIAYVTDTIPKISMSSGGQFTFTSSATESAAGFDSGLGRSSAGVIKVTDGSTGIGRLEFEKDKRQFGTHKTPGTAATVTEYGGAPTHTLTGTASNVSDATGHYVQLSGDGAAAGIDLAATECCKTEIDPVVTFIIKTGAALPTDAGERIWVGLASASLAASDSPSGIHVAAFRYAIDTDNTVYWRCVTNDGGADAGTATITTIAIAATTRYRLTIDATDSASIKFFINGALAATHTTNLPTATQALGTTCLTVDAGASTQEILISKIHYETT